MAQQDKQQYWFKRRQYGYGWTPVTWQGWTLVAILLAIIIGGAVPLLINPQSSTRLWVYLATLVTAVAVFVVITAAKGPRPKWQWGTKPKRQR